MCRGPGAPHCVQGKYRTQRPRDLLQETQVCGTGQGEVTSASHEQAQLRPWSPAAAWDGIPSLHRGQNGRGRGTEASSRDGVTGVEQSHLVEQHGSCMPQSPICQMDTNHNIQPPSLPRGTGSQTLAVPATGLSVKSRACGPRIHLFLN